MRAIRKSQVHEYVWYCAVCSNSYREHIRHLNYFGGEGLAEAGWSVVPTTPQCGHPPDATDESHLYFCPEHKEAGRLATVVVALLDRRLGERDTTHPHDRHPPPRRLPGHGANARA